MTKNILSCNVKESEKKSWIRPFIWILTKKLMGSILGQDTFFHQSFLETNQPKQQTDAGENITSLEVVLNTITPGYNESLVYKEYGLLM